MIALWMLLGAALTVAAGNLFDRPAVAALGAILAVLGLGALAIEELRLRRHRRRVYERWHRWGL